MLLFLKLIAPDHIKHKRFPNVNSVGTKNKYYIKFDTEHHLIVYTIYNYFFTPVVDNSMSRLDYISVTCFHYNKIFN